MDKLKLRVDKWLWSVRIFKSRSKATTACKTGKIRIGEHILKPSSMISVDQSIEIKKDGFNLIFKILKLIEKRVSASLAQECYINQTSEEELNKFKDWYIGKGRNELRQRGAGRPTKRDRRDIENFKEEIYLDEWFDQD